jgi:DNA-binding MarR family transcriptional regulator
MNDTERAARVWRGMRTLVLERHDRRKEVCAALDMSFIRAKALRQLAGGPMTLRELAAALSTDAPYTTLVVDDLERRGLAARSAHPDDRRRKLVTVTPDGLAAARLAGDILNEPPAAVLALTGAELTTLDRILAKLLAAGDQ